MREIRTMNHNIQKKFIKQNKIFNIIQTKKYKHQNESESESSTIFSFPLSACPDPDATATLPTSTSSLFNFFSNFFSPFLSRKEGNPVVPHFGVVLYVSFD